MSHKKKSSFVPPNSIFFEDEQQERPTQTIKSASADLLREVKDMPPEHQKVVKEKWEKRAGEHRESAEQMRENARFNEAQRLERMADFYEFSAKQLNVGA